MSSAFWSKDRYSSLTVAAICAPETAGMRLSGSTPAWFEIELPGLGMLVTVTPEDVLSALPDVDAAESGREPDGVGASEGVAAAAAAGALGAAGSDARTELPNGVGDEVATCADGDTPDAVGRYFLLERSIEPDDCQERLCDRVAPDAFESGLDGEAYF